MPQPGPEHKRLGEHVGTWNVDCSFYMDPAQPPMKVKARETVEMFGPFYTVSLFEADMFGSPYKGRATLGYDPAVGKYVSTWIDTMSPAIFAFSGKFDAAGNVLEQRGEGIDCMTQGPAEYRTTETHGKDGSRVFEMFMRPEGGEETKVFTHVYTRAD
jgi:hypothetical protein